MFSLALIVGLIFIAVLVVGPLCYLLSSFAWMPKSIVYILGICTILIGLWWFMLPISVVRYVGLIDILFGYWSIQKAAKNRGI